VLRRHCRSSSAKTTAQSPTTPVLVGEDDGTITNDEVRATARAYGTQAELFPRMGHNMMLEPGWTHVAERIHNWLTTSGL
jgi:hypothetical protein